MKLIAHRGSQTRSPENTMKAFREAWSLGVDGIELDIQLTADGNIVVFHDSNGVRLAGDRRNIADCDSQTLSSWNISGERIPLLESVLNEVPDKSLALVEVKSGPEMLYPLEILLSQYRHKNVTLLTFDQKIASETAAQFTVPVWLNVEADKTGRMPEIIKFVLDNGIKGISLGWSAMLNRSLVDLVHQDNLPLAVWTVNKPTDAKRAVSWGVDAVMSDYPELMLPVLKNGE